MKKTLALVLAMLFILSVALTGCDNGGDGLGQRPGDKTPQILRLPGSEPPNLDPQLGTDQISIEITNGIYEGLIRVHEGKILPGMAEKWEISPDGLTYTFHLRDAKWSDGKAITAKDFQYSYLRLLDAKTASEYAFQGYYILNGEEYNTGKITDPNQVGIKVIDDKTLEIKLKVPTKYFLALTGFISFMPARQDLVEQYKEAYASSPEKMVYNGPFILKDWQHDASMVLEKNPNYWNKDAIKLDKIEFTIVNDNKTSVNMYEAGDIDMTGIGVDFIEKYKSEGKANFFSDGSEWYFQFNVKGKNAERGKFLGNANFRKAIGYAVDRQAWIDAVLKNGSLPANRYVLPLLMGNEKKFAEEYPLDFYPKNADVAKAKEYLNKALQEIGTTADKMPTFEFLTGDQDAARIQAEAIQDMLAKNLGIKLEIKGVQFKQRLELMNKSDYDIVFAGWGPDYDDPMTYIDLWVTGGGHNNTNWSDPEYDQLVAFAKTSADIKARADAMFKAEQIMMERGPIVPFFYKSACYTIQPYVKGVVRNFIGADPDWVFAYIEK